MARLCDPDINMITLRGVRTPEPSIRDMIIHYYVSNGFTRNEAFDLTIELLSEHDKICKQSLSSA